ncbi:uncharacterized protein LAESUDRAFT_646919 [Laetiporus sulphureus 93-53]|uniref:Snf7-domain-containing protein n=1 Tax=Laetiporus sulphureus 93-53 TaxID=1314785 RepID=A0A165FX64_9APHY|nr:uncharacterized protein LAESUDRAFT_646919 [Laetiporus sulphureus 93-53]KZT09530.1 hypothetical protein LAESUDRAFT_646919 [Laetiporus sulphureus 93-53]
MSPLSNSQLTSLPTYNSLSTSRLKALYSDFSLQKHSNPTSYSSNVEWWRRTLEAVVLRGWPYINQTQSAIPDRLVLHAEGAALSEDFRFEGVGKPLSLPTVISELCAMKAYFSLPEFLSAPQSIYNPGWLPYRIASYVIGKPLWWSLQQLNIMNAEDNTLGHTSYNERWKKVRGDYVVLSLLERAADNVIQRQRRKSDVSLVSSLYNMDSFRREFAGHALEGVVLSDLDLKVLVRYLERDRSIILVQKEVIKFVEGDATQFQGITSVDEGVLELKTAIERLQLQIDSIHVKINERTEQISTSLRIKRKEIALSHLRAKKQLEDLLGKRLNSLDALQSTLLRVEASAGDVEIMKSYESSTVTLRAILAHPSLQRDKIDETMDAMASANADAREIDDAIRVGTEVAVSEAGIDDAELEDELKALIQEEEKETRERVQEEQAQREGAKVQLEREKLTADGLRVPSSIYEGHAVDREDKADSIQAEMQTAH